jgi:hypothetical protein
MLPNERIEKVAEPGGETVRVCFDLAEDQLLAIARIADTVKRERYMGNELDTDAVLTLRELVAINDNALDRAGDGVGGGTVVMAVGRLGLLVDAMREWSESRRDADVSQPTDAEDLAVAEALLPDLVDLRVRAMHAALGTEPPVYTLR